MFALLMGYVLRQVGKTWVHKDTCSIIYDENKKEQLKGEGKAEEKRTVGIVIYSESDFDAFYNKHCLRIPNDNNPFTVMVVNDVNVPQKQEVRALMEEVLRRNRLKLKKGWLSKTGTITEGIGYWELNPAHKVRTFFNNSFVDAPRRGSFRFRDVQTIFPRQLADIFSEGHIPKLELENLKSIWKFAVDPSTAYMCEYAVLYIWIIGHTDII